MSKAADKIKTDLAGRSHYVLLCKDRFYHGLDSLDSTNLRNQLAKQNTFDSQFLLI